MGKFVTKIALVLCVVFGMAVSVSAEEAKAETKKANVFGSKAQNGWLKDFEYSDDMCFEILDSSQRAGFRGKHTGIDVDKHCREYIMEEVKLLIPYVEKKDGKKCNALEDIRIAKGDGIRCGDIKSVLKTLGSGSSSSISSSNERAGNKLVDIKYKVLP